jgi:flavodoxin
MTTAIRYYSKFGHSEKLAQAIGEVAKTTPATVATPLEGKVDVLYLVAGIFLGKINKDMIQFIKNLKPEQVGKVVLVGSSALIQDPVKEMKDALKEVGIAVHERTFSCKGSMGPLHGGHPSSEDIDVLKLFVASIQGE